MANPRITQPGAPLDELDEPDETFRNRARQRMLQLAGVHVRGVLLDAENLDQEVTE
jgi:hypothetical protein